MRLAVMVVTLATMTNVARADTQACIAQSERAQQARTDEHLRLARELFHACTAPDCPESVRTDCLKSYDEVDRATPSIVVIAREHNRDVTNVRVVVDGEAMADTLDGRALFVDPGAHHLRIETHEGQLLIEQDFVAHAGEKNRVVETQVTMPTPHAAVVESHHTAGPWVLMGVGLAGAIAGGVFFGVGQADVTHSHDGCAKNIDGTYTCVPALTTSDGQDRPSLNSTGTTLANVGVITLGVGAAALVAGIIWHFAERPKARVVTFAPTIGGFVLDANF